MFSVQAQELSKKGGFYIKNNKFYTARHDRVFKAIFCNEDNLPLLKEFLERLLKRKVNNISFKLQELPLLNIKERQKIVDVLLEVDGEYIHIELNNGKPGYLHNRNMIFFTTIFNNKTQVGEEYDIETNFIHIDITFGMGVRGKDYDIYYPQTSGGKKNVKNVKIIEYNMDKIKKYWYDKNIQKVNKYKHLIMLDLELKELGELLEGDEKLMDFKERLEKLNKSAKFQSAMTYEEDQTRILNTEKHIAYDKGVSTGLSQGISQGISQRNKEIAQNLITMGLPLEQVSKGTGLSVSQVKSMF